MENVVQDNTCNICNLKFGGGDLSCNDHIGINKKLWNATQEYKDYQNFLVNKKRQQMGLAPLEFNFSKKNSFQDNH